MRCEYDDGFKVDYSGSLQITKGNDVNLFVSQGFLPDNVKNDLAAAAAHNSCSELKHAAQEASDIIHNAWKH